MHARKHDKWHIRRIYQRAISARRLGKLTAEKKFKYLAAAETAAVAVVAWSNDKSFL